MRNFNCKNCDKEFEAYEITDRVYCSRSCYYDYYRSRTLEERFWEKVEKGDENECWEWKGSLLKNGYGQLRIKREDFEKVYLTHRASWIIHNGDIPEDKIICHKCDNPACVNPIHLFLGTHQDNMDDMIEKGRDVRLKGEELPQSKLNCNKVSEIRSILNEGTKTQKEISKMFGIDQAQISRIKNKKAWV